MTDILLISPDAEVLQRWTQAFPAARCFRDIEAAGSSVSQAASVWLHLPCDANEALRLVGELSSRLGSARLVALSDTPSDEQALGLMQHGAVGYCHSHAGPPMLQQVATVISNQGLWVGPNLLSRMIRASLAAEVKAPVNADQLKELSAREHQVARSVARGANNKEIAREMDITERTVKAHLSAIFLKLRVRDRLHLALWMRGNHA
ncbi:MAG: response regulator transcription factor [Pseudomonadales bacterium]|nr:response regulator transcription factor [Pseudomonadales bacterium]